MPPKTRMTREQVAKETKNRHRRLLLPYGMQAGPGNFNRVEDARPDIVPIKRRVNRDMSRFG